MIKRSSNRRLILFLVVTAIAAGVLWTARGALWPFAVGLALAYFMAPVVNRLHRAMPPRLRDRREARPLAILAVYVAFVVAVALALALVVPPVARQASDLLHRAPDLYRGAVDRVQVAIEANRGLIPDAVTPWIERSLEGDLVTRIVGPVLSALRQTAMAALGTVSGTISWLLGLVLVPIWLIYILKDTARVRGAALALVPHDIRADVEALRIICDRVLSGYIHGQVVVAVILGTLFTIALVVLQVPYALLLGFFAGLLAVVPFIGTILGAVPAVAVAFASGAKLALFVVAVFVVIQQIDNLFISPRVQGRSVALNPALIMVVLVIGQRLMGPVGLLVAVPLTAILRDVAHYLYLRIGDDRPSASAALIAVGYGGHATDVVRRAAEGDTVSGSA